jgi:putative hemolysin
MISTALVQRPLTLDLTWRRYRIRLARHQDDILRCLRLRHAVFLQEMLGRSRPDLIERDDFDKHCDHLLITLANNDEIVGTCRIACSLWANRSYSSTEFHLGGFLTAPGIKIEIGRTCLAKAQRNNFALSALGRGIGTYARMVEARWLFGCSSVPMTNPLHIAALTQRLNAEGHSQRSFGAKPRNAYRDDDVVEALERGVSSVNDLEYDALIPPLLRTYLRANAAVSAEPAIDRAFGCYDYLTILDLHNHNHSFLGRFAPC